MFFKRNVWAQVRNSRGRGVSYIVHQVLQRNVRADTRMFSGEKGLVGSTS